MENLGKKNALDRDAMVALTADEVATVQRLVRSEDGRERVASFLEKREAVFRGK
jgi:hypothetical protein